MRRSIRNLSVLFVAGVVIAGVVFYPEWRRQQRAEEQRTKLTTALLAPMKDASQRVEKVIALLGSVDDSKYTARTILQRLERDGADIQARIPDVLILAKEGNTYLTDPVLEYLRSCRSYLEATADFFVLGAARLGKIDEANAAAAAMTILRKAHPEVPNEATARPEDTLAYWRARNKADQLSKDGMDAVMKAYEIDSQLRKAAERQATSLRRLQEIRLQVAKHFPSDAFIPDDVLESAAATSAAISKATQ